MFRNKIYIVVVFFLFTLLVFGCFQYSKEDYLKDFDQWVTQVETNSPNYTNQEWEEADSQYQLYAVQLYEKVYEDLDFYDQQNIGKLKIRYRNLKLKNDIDNIIQFVEDGVQQTIGAIEEVLNK